MEKGGDAKRRRGESKSDWTFNWTNSGPSGGRSWRFLVVEQIFQVEGRGSKEGKRRAG